MMVRKMSTIKMFRRIFLIKLFGVLNICASNDFQRFKMLHSIIYNEALYDVHIKRYLFTLPFLRIPFTYDAEDFTFFEFHRQALNKPLHNFLLIENCS